jgi:hypothetical protein
MAYLDHHRPQLRYLDNLRRELGKVSAGADEAGHVTDWPPFLRPVAARPKALAALFATMHAIDGWIEDDTQQLSLSNPPSPVRRATQVFGEAKVQSAYDPSYTGRDWLADIAGETDPLASALLAVFRLADAVL